MQYMHMHVCICMWHVHAYVIAHRTVYVHCMHIRSNRISCAHANTLRTFAFTTCTNSCLFTYKACLSMPARAVTYHEET